MTPGKVFEAKIALFPVAARIQRGHALRIAIAGGDADTFRRYSGGKAEAFTIHRGGAQASAAEIPLRPWS